MPRPSRRERQTTRSRPNDQEGFNLAHKASTATEEQITRIATICQADTSPLGGQFEGYYATPTEIESMKEAFGPYLRQLGMQLTARAEVDRFVHAILSTGL